MDKAKFRRDLARVSKESPFRVFGVPRNDSGSHPENHRNFEQAFAAEVISRVVPKNILDIGSNRFFITGLLSAYKVTTVDIRPRNRNTCNETLLVEDAKELSLPSNSFDLVLSLCSIEHFGLGRYGDALDLDADTLAVKEMIRVLKPGGWLVFSTNIHRAETVIQFNAHRIYSKEHIVSWFADSCSLLCELYCKGPNWRFVPYEQVTNRLGRWNVYCGCWKKR